MSNIRKYLDGFMRFKPLLKELVKREIKVRYRHSALGMVWTVLNPLLSMLVLTVVFSYMLRMDIENFPLYVLIGNIVFGFNSDATNQGMTAIVNNASLIKKVYIPKYMFPLSNVLSCLVNFAFSFIAMILVMIFTGAKFHITIVTIWIPMLYLMLFSFGLSLILSTVNVFFRDTQHLYGVFLTAWMYFSGIFYSIDFIPEKLKVFIDINPMYQYINFFRQVIMYGVFPGVRENLMCIFWSILMLALGLSVFYKNQDKFILHI